MKKITALICAAILTAALTACAAPAGGATQSPSVSQEPVTIESLGYQALESLPKDYPSDLAAKSGDMVIKDGGVENAAKLADFVDKAARGEPAMLRMLQYTADGDPIITDYIFNQDHRGYFHFRQDNSRDRHSSTGIKESYYSYLITDGQSLFLSNCADMALIRTYPGAALIRIGFYENLGDISKQIGQAEKMTKDRVAGKAAPYKSYAPDGVQSVALIDGTTYVYDNRSSSETAQVKDPDGIATLVTDVFWLDNTSFVLTCTTKTDGLVYFAIVGTDAYQSDYGKSFAMIEGRFTIMK